MSLKCKLGFHAWSKDCEKCFKCGNTRENRHNWLKDCEKCSKCHKTRENHHSWSKDCEKCLGCGKIRENQHVFVNEICKNCGRGTFTDARDSKTYEMMKIGTQIIMAENLAYKPESGNYWDYNNNQNNVKKYGYLYEWETAFNACPSGWHLPSDEEWKILEQYLGMTTTQANIEGFRGIWIGDQMKSATGWKLCEGKNFGNNWSGFNALPSGYANSGVTKVGEYGEWWSSTPYDYSSAWLRYLHYDNNKVGRGVQSRERGCSVRCFKN